MIRRGRRNILLADHTKVNAAGHAVFAELSDYDTWYTSAGIEPGRLRRFRKMTTVVPVQH
jgi:DeoR/GlpR family transcriptional regulator of sugar metabolism